MNREMLKEAIAEAKTIKETAIANAKAALEEAFTPQLTAMFAEKLNELEEEEVKEEMTDENYSLEEEGLEEDFNLEEILAELDGLNEEDEKMEETEDNLEENLMLEEMSDEEIEELILKVLRQEIESGNIEAGENFEEETEVEDMEDMDDMGGEEEEESEEVKLDELLAEILGEEEKVEEGLFDKIKSFFGSVLSNFENENKDVITKFQNSKKTKEDQQSLSDFIKNEEEKRTQIKLTEQQKDLRRLHGKKAEICWLGGRSSIHENLRKTNWENSRRVLSDGVSTLS